MIDPEKPSHKGIKKGEITCESYYINDELRYIITSIDKDYSMFFLYEVINSIAVKTQHKSTNPKDLEEYMDYWGENLR